MQKKDTKKMFICSFLMIPAFVCCGLIASNTDNGSISGLFEVLAGGCCTLAVICFFIGIVRTISNMTNRSKILQEEKRQLNIQTTSATSGSLPNGMIYKVDGVRGRQLEVYKDRCVLRVTVTAGSLITGNYSDGEKTIYYADCVGVQFKESGIQIGYLQLETATGLMNNKGDNFFNENSFTFDESVVTNAKMREIANYVRERISEAKNRNNSTVVSQVSSADELKKYKDLLDSGVITKEEFDAKKKQLLGL